MRCREDSTRRHRIERSIEQHGKDGIVVIGLGSYAYFWRASSRVERPMSLLDQLSDAARLDVHLFQICDHAPLADMSEVELREVRDVAADLGMRLELGTKGIAPRHLDRYLEIAGILGASLVRSMVTAPDHRPTDDEAERLLTDAVPRLVEHGVTLALETYEQLPSDRLVDLVDRVGHPSVGICLDPANNVACFEHPNDVVDRCAPHVVNWHVKDFAFYRNSGWVGFTYAGAPLGKGSLDYERTASALARHGREVNRIVEFWLPWQDDEKTTVATEAEWTVSALTYLKEKEDG